MNNEIKENFKMIVITIVVSMLLGTVIFLIYDAIREKNPETEQVEEFIEEDASLSTIENLDEKVEVEKENNQIDIGTNIGENFSVNNDNPLKDMDGYQKAQVKFSGTGHSVRFYFPNSWKNKVYTSISGDNVYMYNMTMDMRDVEYTNYDEFLEKFVEKIKNQNLYTDEDRKKMNFTSRKIQMNGKEYKVLMREEDGRSIVSYLCFVKDRHAFYLEAHVRKDEYDAKTIKAIDTIFNSFVVL